MTVDGATAARRPSSPSVSVIVPVAGEQPDLPGQVAAVLANRYDGERELVLVDNGAGPVTAAEIRRLAGAHPEVRVVAARERPGITWARNAGAAVANGDLLVFCDADDIVAEDWLPRLVVAAGSHDVVGGHLDTSVANPATAQAWRTSLTTTGLPTALDFLPYAVGANMAIWRDTYQAVGGCDVAFRAGDDVDLSWRVQLAGGSVGFAPDARVHYRLRTGFRANWHQSFAYGVGAARLYAKFRHAGARRPGRLDTAKYWVRLLARSGPALARRRSRYPWIRELAHSLGRSWGDLTIALSRDRTRRSL